MGAGWTAVFKTHIIIITMTIPPTCTITANNRRTTIRTVTPVVLEPFTTFIGMNGGRSIMISMYLSVLVPPATIVRVDYCR